MSRILVIFTMLVAYNYPSYSQDIDAEVMTDIVQKCRSSVGDLGVEAFRSCVDSETEAMRSETEAMREAQLLQEMESLHPVEKFILECTVTATMIGTLVSEESEKFKGLPEPELRMEVMKSMKTAENQQGMFMIRQAYDVQTSSERQNLLSTLRDQIGC